NRFLGGCLSGLVWLLGAVLYLILLRVGADRLGPARDGTMMLGASALLFFLAWRRPRLIRMLQEHPNLQIFGAWGRNDRIGEALLVVFGLGLLVYGLILLLR